VIPLSSRRAGRALCSTRGGGTWNLLVGTYNGSIMRLYLNGVEVNNVAKSGALDYGTHGP